MDDASLAEKNESVQQLFDEGANQIAGETAELILFDQLVKIDRQLTKR
jgi:hypothetical protein